MPIAILTGGTSQERDVAIRSSIIFRENLPEADFYTFPEDLEQFLLNYTKYTLAIPVFHGTYGEDGQIFAFLKTLGIRTAFSPWEVHALTIDKFVTDTLIRRAHPVPNECIIKRGMPIAPPPGEYPFVVKPNRGGSTIGTNLVKDRIELEWAVKEIHTNHDDDALVQTLLPGREFTVSILGNDRPEVL
jgi:D-alanine-D-alanine ligase